MLEEIMTLLDGVFVIFKFDSFPVRRPVFFRHTAWCGLHGSVAVVASWFPVADVTITSEST
jgi:hypothetical protein